MSNFISPLRLTGELVELRIAVLWWRQEAKKMVHARVTSEQNPKKLRASEKQQKAEGVVPQQNPAKVHLLP